MQEEKQSFFSKKIIWLFLGVNIGWCLSSMHYAFTTTTEPWWVIVAGTVVSFFINNLLLGLLGCAIFFAIVIGSGMVWLIRKVCAFLLKDFEAKAF
ncbi:hypothetical protein C4546_00560 [Candidatus Parcubacteria bacterium]|jgi:Na+/phosphate symporter|nr:MAG: hypothetical protein C4546_00560 [Candidatus Parcubacteria bacterium]